MQLDQSTSKLNQSTYSIKRLIYLNDEILKRNKRQCCISQPPFVVAPSNFDPCLLPSGCKDCFNDDDSNDNNDKKIKIEIKCSNQNSKRPKIVFLPPLDSFLSSSLPFSSSLSKSSFPPSPSVPLILPPSSLPGVFALPEPLILPSLSLLPNEPVLVQPPNSPIVAAPALNPHILIKTPTSGSFIHPFLSASFLSQSPLPPSLSVSKNKIIFINNFVSKKII